MALQSSGPISLSQINTELGRSSTAAITLNTAEDGGYVAINSCSTNKPSATNPAAMSEWYGYNHTASCGISCSSTPFTIDPPACGVFESQQVNIGSATGTVTINYTYSLASGFGYHEGYVSVFYGPVDEGNIVANTPVLVVQSGGTTTISGTLSFTANGSYPYYIVRYTDFYCY
jgi:hypothetical protein